jgi:hypothetical protein
MEENYLISLIVLAFCYGLVFFKKETRISLEPETKKYSLDKKVSGLTGVDKYLQDKFPQIEDTGVAKYLASKEQGSPVSGVSKYLAQQAAETKQSVKENASGVEKYLNNRG